MIERLEARRLLSATHSTPAQLDATAPFGVTGKGSLYIQGTQGNDVIDVHSDDDGVIIVSMNALQGFRFEGVKRVHVEGAAGHDRISFNSSMNIPATLLGGAGDDRIEARGRRVTLVGGAGNDDLIGRDVHGMHFIGGAGNDRIMGSAGIDTIWGGLGDDIADRSPGADLLDSIERRMKLNL
jgi:Ca2+-binding RTX toxin-like protein